MPDIRTPRLDSSDKILLRHLPDGIGASAVLDSTDPDILLVGDNPVPIPENQTIDGTTNRIQAVRNTTSGWNSSSLILRAGEPAYDTSTGLLRIGDGVSTYSKLGVVGSSINAGSFIGADPTGTTDSTAAIQAAIQTAVTFKIGEVVIPAGRWLINGTITIPAELSLRGHYTGYATSGRVLGTVLVAGVNANGDPVIQAKNPTTGGYLAGVSIQDLFVLGSSGWTSNSGAKDRVGIHLYKVISEYRISGVMVTGFQRQGVLLEEAYDGTMSNVRIMFCGTDGGYAALHLAGTAQGNTNSLHAFGIHIENCPFILKAEGNARHNAFVASKFELFSQYPVNSPMVFGVSRETTFVGCYFVSRNADDPNYADSSTQPHFIRVADTNAVVTFTDCNFNNGPYTGTPTVDPTDGTNETFDGGARWVKVTSGRVQLRGGITRVAWGGAGAAPFQITKGSIVSDMSIYTSAKGGTRTLFDLNTEAQVTNCEIVAQNGAATPTAGALFNCTGARNIIGPNSISGNVSSYISTSVIQTVRPHTQDITTYSGGPSVNIGWVNRYASETFTLSLAAAGNVSEFTGGWTSREATVRFGNANTTLVHSASLMLKGSVNATPPANAYMKFIANSANVWTELSRSF